MEPAAMIRPASAAPPAHSAAASVDAPKLVVPKAAAPMSSAAPRPSATPATPLSADSLSATRTSWRVDAPRVRSSALSRRRRSAPAAAIDAVTSPARIAPGTPRNRNSSSA